MDSFDEKTELEKRWEAEEPQEPQETSNPYSKSEEEPTEYSKGDDESLFIMSPLADEDIPLVVVSNNNRWIIGGLLDVMGEGVVMDHPMAYIEAADQRNPGRVQIGVQKLFHGLGIPLNMWIKHDSLNMLRKEDAAAGRVASIYERTFSDLKAAEVGVTAPSPTDLQAYARKDVRR